MPTAPPRQCRQANCGKYAVTRGYCADHAKAVEQRRGTASERGYTGSWLRLREAVLLRDKYLCQEHMRQGQLYDVMRVPGDAHVDHITPKALGGKDSMENLQTLCRHHHAVKTLAEGSFGRATLALESKHA